MNVLYLYLKYFYSRKYSARIQEQEEHIETLLVKVNNLEKQKSRLQSEVEVLIIDLEKVKLNSIVNSNTVIMYIVSYIQANNTARDLQKRVEHLERVNIDLKSRLDETTALFEQGQRDLRNKQNEIQRLTHELDKTREQKDQLTRENKKLAGKYILYDHYSNKMLFYNHDILIQMIYMTLRTQLLSTIGDCTSQNWSSGGWRMNVMSLALLTKKLKLYVFVLAGLETDEKKNKYFDGRFLISSIFFFSIDLQKIRF